MDQTTLTPSHARRHRHLARLAVVLMVVGLFGTVLVSVQEALAANATRCVKFVDFDARPDACLEDNAVPCLPDAGTGRSNTIYVRQHEVGGESRYDEVFGTGHGGSVWFQTTLAGECSTGHRLSSLHIKGGHEGDHAGQVDEVDSATFSVSQPVDHDHQTVPNRNVAVHVPADQVQSELLMGGPVDLAAWGEARIAERVADGVSEHNARVEPYTTASWAGMNATLTCRRLKNDRHPYATDSTWHPVEIVWLGVGMEPGDETDDGWRDGLLPADPTPPAPIDPNLSIGFQVTQAHLSAIPDPADACLLHLSGVVTTTEPGVVTYRFVNELGQRSQAFDVHIDQTRTAMFAHQVQLDPIVLDPAGPDGPPGAFTAEDDGEIGGLVHEGSDNVQGYYQLEVVEPHGKLSDIASYNVDGCVVTGPEGSDPTNPGPSPGPGGLTTPPPPSVPPVPVPPPGNLVNPNVPPAPVPPPQLPPVIVAP
jgi:hypothetical protein